MPTSAGGAGGVDVENIAEVGDRSTALEYSAVPPEPEPPRLLDRHPPKKEGEAETTIDGGEKIIFPNKKDYTLYPD
jgi:hypothetical protein